MCRLTVWTSMLEAKRGSLYPCTECSKACPAHGFADKTWQHLNFFQHHCDLHARMPRTKCSVHGIKRIEVDDQKEGIQQQVIGTLALRVAVRPRNP